MCAIGVAQSLLVWNWHSKSICVTIYLRLSRIHVVFILDRTALSVPKLCDPLETPSKMHKAEWCANARPAKAQKTSSTQKMKTEDGEFASATGQCEIPVASDRPAAAAHASLSACQSAFQSLVSCRDAVSMRELLCDDLAEQLRNTRFALRRSQSLLREARRDFDQAAVAAQVDIIGTRASSSSGGDQSVQRSVHDFDALQLQQMSVMFANMVEVAREKAEIEKAHEFTSLECDYCHKVYTGSWNESRTEWRRTCCPRSKSHPMQFAPPTSHVLVTSDADAVCPSDL